MFQLIGSGVGVRDSLTKRTSSYSFSSRILGFTVRIAWSKGVKHQRLTCGHKGIARPWVTPEGGYLELSGDNQRSGS